MTEQATDSVGTQAVEKLWNIAYCADYLDIANSTLRRMVEKSTPANDGIPYIWISGMIRFDPPTIRAWAARQKDKPAKLPDEAA